MVQEDVEDFHHKNFNSIYCFIQAFYSHDICQ